MAPLNSDVMCIPRIAPIQLSATIWILVAAVFAPVHQAFPQEEDFTDILLEKVCTQYCRDRIEFITHQDGRQRGLHTVAVEMNNRHYECSVKNDADEYYSVCQVESEYGDQKMSFHLEIDEITGFHVKLYPDQLPESVSILLKTSSKTLLRLDNYEIEYVPESIAGICGVCSVSVNKIGID